MVLIRNASRDLTTQRAKLVAKRKAAYEAVHGSAKAAGARAANRAMGRGDASAKFASAFTSDTATKTGQSKRKVQLDAQRGEALGADLDRVAGTSLDKGAELDALAAMSAQAREEVIERAAAGENVSAPYDHTQLVSFRSLGGRFP